TSAAAPIPQHLSTDHNVLHRKNVDVLDRTTRSLIVEIEFTDRIHVVAEELDAHRVAHQRRKDIDDSATDGELTWGTNGFLPQVAGAGQMLNKEVLRKI